MTLLLATLLLLQVPERPARQLSPAETLLGPAILGTLDGPPVEGPAVEIIAGSDKSAGEIVLSCARSGCESAEQAMKRLARMGAPPPPRTIRLVRNLPPLESAKAEIFITDRAGNELALIPSLWSNASIADEVVELFAREKASWLRLRNFEVMLQQPLRVGITTLVVSADADPLGAMHREIGAFVAAASAHFLATLPNAGAEALLSHLVVGAHARLAEDGRRAVAMMGTQQRASAEVLIMFGQAIEREQRRMLSFERFMPEPVEPMLRSRLADMEKGITSVWTSMGITSSPFVPAAERIRGRGGDDRRVPVRTAASLPAVDLPGQFGKFIRTTEIIYELGSFIDGKRTISDIRDAVSAEFGSVPLPPVVEYFERLAKTGAITLR